MSSEETKISEFNQYRKSDKALFIIYANLEYLIEKINGCKNIPEKSSITKVSKHIPSDSSRSTIPSFKSYGNAKNVLYFFKKMKINMLKIKNIAKLETIVIIQVNLKILLMVYVI